MRQQIKDVCLPNPANAVYCNYPDIYINDKPAFREMAFGNDTIINFNCQNENGTTVVAELAKANDVYIFTQLLKSQHIFDCTYVPTVLGAVTPLAQSVKSGSFDVTNIIVSNQIDTVGVDKYFYQTQSCGYNCEASTETDHDVCHSPIVYAASYNGFTQLQALSHIFPANEYSIFSDYPTKDKVLESFKCTYTDYCPTNGDQSPMTSAISTATVLILGILAIETSLF